MKKKIIISIIPHLKGGGVEKVVSVLSEGLNKFDDCEVHIITIKPFENLIPLAKEVKIHALDTNLRNIFKQRISNRSKFRLIIDYIKKILPKRNLISFCVIKRLFQKSCNTVGIRMFFTSYIVTCRMID